MKNKNFGTMSSYICSGKIKLEDEFLELAQTWNWNKYDMVSFWQYHCRNDYCAMCLLSVATKEL